MIYYLHTYDILNFLHPNRIKINLIFISSSIQIEIMNLIEYFISFQPLYRKSSTEIVGHAVPLKQLMPGSWSPSYNNNTLTSTLKCSPVIEAEEQGSKHRAINYTGSLSIQHHQRRLSLSLTHTLTYYHNRNVIQSNHSFVKKLNKWIINLILTSGILFQVHS